MLGELVNELKKRVDLSMTFKEKLYDFLRIEKYIRSRLISLIFPH